jgi:hypothetical protein
VTLLGTSPLAVNLRYGVRKSVVSPRHPARAPFFAAIADNDLVAAALLRVLLACALTWGLTFIAVVAGRLRVCRNPGRLRGVRRLTAATSRTRRLRLASDRRRRRRWTRIEAVRLIAETSTPLRLAERRELAAALADRTEDVRLGALAAVSLRADGRPASRSTATPSPRRHPGRGCRHLPTDHVSTPRRWPTSNASSA